MAIQPIGRLKPRSMSMPKQVNDTLTSRNGVAALWAATPGRPAALAREVGNLAQDAVLTGLAT